MKKALKDDQVLDVLDEYSIMRIECSFTYSIDDCSLNIKEEKDTIKKKNIIEDNIGYTLEYTPTGIKHSKEGKYYSLSNGETYHEDDIIVGLDNIRDKKIEDLL